MKKEKYLQIFNYLLEFSKLRSKPIRDIRTSSIYNDIVWLSDVPINDNIDCVTHGKLISGNEDYWLKITKPKEPIKPIFPPTPKILEKWIDKNSLLNREDLPELLSEIDIDGQIEILYNHPEIEVEFENYCDNIWFADAENYWLEYEIYKEQYAVFEQINLLYKKLFTIFNKSQQFGEEYELIFGIGLMNFRENNETPQIFRHILTVKCDIHFEFSKTESSIIIAQNIDSELSIETDAFIDLTEQFESYDILEAEKLAKELIQIKELTSPFDNDVHGVLQLLSERFKPSEGKYIQSLTYDDNVPRKETVFYAPALILRKRDTRSYTSVFEQIIENIKQEENPDIPILKELIEENSDVNNPFQNNYSYNLSGSAEVIYFPNKYNDEQIAIINRARQYDKILVQGPPGTGKSHTIANLICHLLANNKKVLVTAYTKRALEVLKAKLPEEFRELAVSLLSGDSSSIQGLEASINKINEKLSHTDIGILEKEIFELEEKLNLLREEKKADVGKLLTLKEKSSQKYTLSPKYKGSLTKISELLDSEKQLYDWYKDDFDEFDNDYIIKKIENYYRDFENYSTKNLSVFDFKLPFLHAILDKESLTEYYNLHLIINGNDNLRYLAEQVVTNNIINLRDHLLKLLEYSNEVDSINVSCKEKIKEDFFQNQKRKWFNKIERTRFILKGLDRNTLRLKDQNCEVIYPVGKSLIALKSDAKILLDFLQEGNKFSGVKYKIIKSFFPNEIKERLNFIEDVKVNGSLCNSIREFEIVLEDIQIRQSFEELYEIWSLTELDRNYEVSYEFFDDYIKQIEALSKLIIDSLTTVGLIESSSNIKVNELDSITIREYLKSIDFLIKLDRYNYYKRFKKQISEELSKEGIHSIGKEIIQAIDSFNFNKYDNLIQQLSELHNLYDSYNSYKRNEAELLLYTPNLIKQISTREITEKEILSLEDAFQCKHAKNELKRLLRENHEFELIQKIKEYDIEESKLIALLSSSKTWFYVLVNLQQNNSLRQHLEAWVQAVKRIGKTGKGKRALKFRKMAQKEMEHCKTAIPCWIMPLYKVTETIKPEQGLYDYVIVDEASQLGPDAIFLLYISKNIIIVGDDKQTSPEYVGVDANAMTPFIYRYLKGIPFQDFYGTESSFFDHAKRFRGAEVILREHFRCMPEIIEFSNKLFYAPDGKGLYPLKQYSENRLPPLMHCYCPEGYTEGTVSNLQNKNEALAIVNKIKEIVHDERYSKKSIGVICLQGTAQSNLIESLLIKEIGETEYNKRKIICGNSASFQGDERDVIFLSLVTAKNHNRSALTRQEDERRFNVAVSRAIEQIWLFHSVQLEDLSNQNDLRFKILNHFIHYKTSLPPISSPVPRTTDKHPDPFDSWFEVDVYNDIVNRGINVKPKYEVVKGKYRLDMVAFLPGGAKIAIVCEDDIWYGTDQCKDHLLSLKVLERCGWQLFSIKGGEYYSDREKSLKPLWEMCKRLSYTNHVEVGIITDKEDSANNEASAIKMNNEGFDDNAESILEFSDNSSIEERQSFESNISDPIIRYYNLFETGNYIMSDQIITDAAFSIPIRQSQESGYLLQCYDSGNVNKVLISRLLSRRIGKEYMNGINRSESINRLIIIEKDEILGLIFYENGDRLFKSHLIENISSRELPYLQGIKVLYNDFDNLEYHIIPISEYENIKKLVFQSFTAKGKSMKNTYYDKEWIIIKKYLHDDKNININKSEVEKTFTNHTLQAELFNDENEVKVNKCIIVHYLHNDLQLSIKLVENHNGDLKTVNGVQIVNSQSPLGVSLLGKKEGEIVKIGTSNKEVRIVKIFDS